MNPDVFVCSAGRAPVITPAWSPRCRAPSSGCCSSSPSCWTWRPGICSTRCWRWRGASLASERWRSDNNSRPGSGSGQRKQAQLKLEIINLTYSSRTDEEKWKMLRNFICLFIFLSVFICYREYLNYLTFNRTLLTVIVVLLICFVCFVWKQRNSGEL